MQWSVIMLPPEILDELRRRDVKRRTNEAPQPMLELPLPPPPPPRRVPALEESERGVVVFDLF
jgi:hypothetical protein